jgi:hypothetical protein
MADRTARNWVRKAALRAWIGKISGELVSVLKAGSTPSPLQLTVRCDIITGAVRNGLRHNLPIRAALCVSSLCNQKPKAIMLSAFSFGD